MPRRTIQLWGFDSHGDPALHVEDDGQLTLIVNFMPPSDFEGGALGVYESFATEMSAAIGVPVLWDDREVFRIRTPRTDTIDRLTAFITNFRSRSNPADKHKFGPGGTCFDKGCSEAHPFAVGQRVRHFKFGEGEIINYDRHDANATIRVRFADGVMWVSPRPGMLEILQ
jgi:hypothetical protein